MDKFVYNILKEALNSNFNVLVQMSKDINATNKALILKRLDNGATYNYNVFNGEINAEVKSKEMIEKFNSTLTNVLTTYKIKDGYKILIKNVLPGRQAKFIRPSQNSEIVVLGNDTENPGKVKVIETFKM